MICVKSVHWITRLEITAHQRNHGKLESRFLRCFRVQIVQRRKIISWKVVDLNANHFAPQKLIKRAGISIVLAKHSFLFKLFKVQHLETRYRKGSCRRWHDSTSMTTTTGPSLEKTQAIER